MGGTQIKQYTKGIEFKRTVPVTTVPEVVTSFLLIT